MRQFAPEDTARHYEAAHDRIVGLVSGLTEEQAAAPVAATPGWTVHDVLAHLAANTTDGLAGRIQGIPDDEFTAGQIRERKAATIADLVAEWADNMATMLEAARAGLAPPNLAVDAVTHEQDIRGALGVARVDDREAVRFSVDLFGEGVRHKMKAASGLALHVESTDGDFVLDAGEGGAPSRLRAPEFELMRTFSGRRGRTQVLAMDWDGDPSAYLPWLNLFGNVPEGVVCE